MLYDMSDAPSRGEAARDFAVDQANTRMWWTDHHNLHMMAEWMHSTIHVDHCYDLANILEMLEKPWHWTDEWISACEEEASENEEPVGNVIARRLGATKLTITIIEVPDDEPVVDEDMFRGDR
jgi:hypothetical protein